MLQNSYNTNNPVNVMIFVHNTAAKLLKGLRHRDFPGISFETSLKFLLNTFATTKNASGTPRGRFQMSFRKECNPQYVFQ